MQKIQPEMETIKQKYPGLYQGDKAAQEAFSRETNALFARHKTSPASALMMMPLSLSQVFIFGTFFFSLQNLCAAKASTCSFLSAWPGTRRFFSYGVRLGLAAVAIPYDRGCGLVHGPYCAGLDLPPPCGRRSPHAGHCRARGC